MSALGWAPDPTGRHQLRWHDGRTFTDQVADDGVMGTDDGLDATSSVAGGPVRSVRRRRRKLPFVAAGLGLLAAAGGGAALLLLDRGGAEGFGAVAGSVASDGAGVAHRLRVPAGSVVTVTVDPTAGLDAQVALVVDPDDHRRLAEAFVGTALAAAYDGDPLPAADVLDGLDLDATGVDPDAVLAGPGVADLGFAGDDEELVALFPADVEVTLVVGGGFEQTDGEVAIEIVHHGVDGGDDADVLLEAATGGDGGDALPRTTTGLVDDLLEALEG